MRRFAIAALLALSATVSRAAPAPDNALIDYDAFAANVQEVRALREAHRISEAEFMRMAAEAETVVLDARSERLYRLRHVKGAVNLSFPEFTEQTLARAIPSKATRVLIYCNNNFSGAPQPFPAKMASASLNLSTFVALYDYGYRNVYELGPNVKLEDSKLPFEGSLATGQVATNVTE